MAAANVVRFGVNPPRAETGKPGNIVSGNPTTRLQNYFTDDTGQFFSGFWESSPGKWRVAYAENEFCCFFQASLS